MNPVEWTPAALNQLAAVYVAAGPAERGLLAEAAEEVDRILTESAADEGESRGGFARVFFQPLLVVYYTVIPDHPVTVVGVRANRPRRQRPGA